MASSGEVRRVLRLAAEFGIAPAVLRLGADGSVLISAASAPVAVTTDEPDEALAAWEAERNLAQRS